MALLARRLVPVLNGCEDAFWAGGPGEWLGIGFGIDDEAVDGELQVNDRLEDAALKALALELREDAFHGVKPGCGGRRKVERLTRMTRQPSAYLWVLGGGIIVATAWITFPTGECSCWHLFSRSSRHCGGRRSTSSWIAKLGLGSTPSTSTSPHMQHGPSRTSPTSGRCPSRSISTFSGLRWCCYLRALYHHFISYYLTASRTEFAFVHWLGSHGTAVALQATVGASISLALAYLSYELFEKRFLSLKRLFATAEEPAPQPAAGAARPDTRWRPISDAKCH